MSDVDSISDPLVVGETQGHEESFPPTYTITVGPYEIEMVLLKGDTFSMGYNGQGSRSMNSEPVHEVTLSSFYVNAKPLSKEMVSFLKKGSGSGKSESTYRPSGRKDAKEIVDKIAELTDLPVSLISEAQWKYTATNRGEVFNSGEGVYCLDFYSDYLSNHQNDPTGPKMGRSSVIRIMSNDSDIYARFDSFKTKPTLFSAIRFTLPASALK